LGIAQDQDAIIHGWGKAFFVATLDTYKISVDTLKSLGQMIVGNKGGEELGGPIRIAQMAGQVTQEGWINLLWMMGLLSVNLGLINLFPIPMLDGGHLLFYMIEAIRGKPLSEKAQEIGFRIGFAFVITLMLYSTWNDLIHLKVFQFFAKFIGL
jgi:regulator of sigma E protease